MINLDSLFKNNLLSVRVIPNSGRNEIVIEGDKVRIYLKSIPDKNKANQELIKFLKKEFGLSVEIKSGMKSRDKILKIID
ncbi:MAG: DUF167 domain-containing protein [archaeon]|nr:DUF167 domain-containing protein [archaeon]